VSGLCEEVGLLLGLKNEIAEDGEYAPEEEMSE
jgi:hypothetical protein